jgi:O-antigen/teichoic acid export membrane protein
VPDFDKERLHESSLLDPAIVPRDVATVAAAKTGGQKSLDRILIRGVAWTAAVKWLTQIFTWGTTVVVAHLLLPSDYGLVGMAAIYINLFTLFSEFGIGTAVVTLQDMTEDQVSQLNTVSVLTGILGFLISAAAAVPLGRFFRAPNLQLVVIVLSCGFIVSGVRTVPYSLLQKELRFKLLAGIEGLQGVVQAAVTVVLAFLGFGYWALVLGILSFSVTPTCLVLLWRRQSFAFPRWSSIHSALRYSRHILVGRLSWALYNDSDFIVAGRLLGETPLGVYTLAWTLAHTPLEKLTTLVNRVTPSVFAKIQIDQNELRRYLRNITGAMALVIFPVTIGMALVAPEFVPLILGARWIGVILPLEILVLHALVRSNVILIIPLLNVIGEEQLVMWNSLACMVVLPISFYVGSRWGTAGIATGWVVVYPLLQVPLFSRIFRKVDFPRSEYLGTMWPAVSGCVVMALSVEGFKWFCGTAWPLYARLVVEILVGAAAYGVVLLLLHHDYLGGIVRFARKSKAESK